MASDRFRPGDRVQVVEHYHDARYAECIGQVVEVTDEVDSVHPRGRVRVTLVWEDLHHTLFGGKAPVGVWFRPNSVQKIDPYQPGAQP